MPNQKLQRELVSPESEPNSHPHRPKSQVPKKREDNLEEKTEGIE